MFRHQCSASSFKRVFDQRVILSLSVGSLFLIQTTRVRAEQSPPQQPTEEAQNDQKVTMLQPGGPVERELTGGQKHSYYLSLSQGQFVKIEIKQQGIDVGVLVQSPEGETTRLTEPLRMTKERTLELIAESTGRYRLDVYAGANVPKGRYEMCITELRAANANDRALQQAQRLFHEYFLLQRQGKLAEARPVLIRALEIREKVLGPDHLLVATTIEHLATIHATTGDYTSAVALRERALAIKEKVRGPMDPDVAYALNALGVAYYEKGDLVKAAEMFQRALSIYEQLDLTENLNVASLLGYLGHIYYAREDYSTAERYYERSRAIHQKLLGPNHYHLAASFSALGLIAYARGDYLKAEEMFQRALSLAENNIKDGIGMSRNLNNLAMLYGTTREYGKAEALYLRALSLHEKYATLTSPDAQIILFGLARIYAAQGRVYEAVKFQTWGSESEERYVELNLTVGSEREKLSLVGTLSSRLSRTISLHAHLAPDDPDALKLALTTILRRKGRVQDMMSEGLVGLRRRFAIEDQKLLDQLNDVTSKLANRTLNGPQKETLAEHREQIKTLEHELEDLEAEISRRSAGFYDHQPPVTVKAVQALIPRQAALVEFAVYRPFNPKAPDNREAYGEPHYIAYVLRSQSEPTWKELGQAKVIDAQLDALRAALADAQRSNVKQLARAVDEKVMQPIRALVGDATQLIISPDGALNLLPLEALVDEQNHFLVERFAFNYLTSGRDLLRLQVRRWSKSNPIVFADPLFGTPESKAATSKKSESASIENSRKAWLDQQTVTTSSDLSKVYFAPLHGTVQEALAIKSLFKHVQVLTGTQASESSLKHLSAPWILHIATHGFFLSDRLSPASNFGRPELTSANAGADPLLRSGLAFSGANLRNVATGDDGILTALEASGLDLWGTKLVVLSACDTGLGQVENGEGVYGLRRAFVLAGAESLVMSLWSVNDYSTRRLMVDYYKNLKRGMGRGAGLREVQLQMLKRNPTLHPFYWANFIQSGDWTSLGDPR